MGYAQPVRSPKGDYYLARYLASDGRYGSVKDPRTGKNIRYQGKRDAKKAASAAEAAVREGRLRVVTAAADPATITLRQWASIWYASLALAPKTMASYRDNLQLHILPGLPSDEPLTGLLSPHVEALRNGLRADGYADKTVRLIAGILRSCLGAAKAAGIIPLNPAAAETRRGTGRRGVARAAAAAKSAEKVIVDMLGGLLVAERMAILTGRDSEFVLGLLLEHAMLRLGEGIGLETRHVTPGTVRVEWQITELEGLLLRDIPKYGSRGPVAVPWFMTELLAWQIAEFPQEPCRCHALTYVFGGKPDPRGRRKTGGVSVRDVAGAAGVPPAAVWGVLADGARYAPSVRAAVLKAAKELGWLTGAAPADPVWHWRQAEIDRLVSAAASGMLAAQGKGRPELAVPLAGEWPGTRLRRKGAAARAEWCWMPVARGLTPHGLRHSQRTEMEHAGVPQILAEAQMRHEQRGIDVYRHVTDQMREDYRERMGETFRSALLRRLEMSPSSPVRVAEMLLREAAGDAPARFLARISQDSRVTVLRPRR